tara:strand:+ start:830 stop:1114 length:285 start_codon:yes stop_codon:yes gene_type:complete
MKESNETSNHNPIKDDQMEIRDEMLVENKKLMGSEETLPKWINNDGEAIEQVFGFNANAELVNGRAAMFGFLMLIVTELIFDSEPVTKALFGIG